MRKSDKKIENKIRQTLTEVCDFALLHINGYLWITHKVNYQRFPDSLIITCMFTGKGCADNALQQGELARVIQQKLTTIGIKIKTPNKQIRFLFE